ncbi:hypothetical protein EDC04DRAFT_2568878 [Pisolithus marmoratus]|nr:hypothetical protein EDC04DRAFT_2568878 [Pisolithus marmoratus]
MSDPFEDEEGNVQTTFPAEIDDDHINRPGPVPSAPVVSTITHRQRVYHPNPPVSRPGGLNLLQRMEMDQYAPIRNSENIYFPFASRSEWELADWLSRGALSHKEIDTYLRLERNTLHPLSFKNAKDLRSRIESLPDVPRWRYQEIKVDNYQTKSPIMLYWRDGLEVVEYLFSNPVFTQCMDISPYKEFEGQERVYGEFMSADDAWRIQDELPDGHSFLGVIGTSDKTPLTIGTGNKEMHPLLLSLANIHAGVRMKATSHAFALAAYLPIPKFRNVSPAVQAVLSARIYHFAISIVVRNLIIANRDGKEMSDPLGNRRTMHTPLVCLTKRLNGVVEPFWAIWGDACPSRFLTPEALHQWHKFYFDHCVRWVTNIIGGEELDHRLAALQPRVGTRHWANGVSTLKQCTGREHRELEKLLPAVAAGALPDDVLCALRAITEFIFLAQGLFHYDETLHSLNEALREFHHYKSSILRAGGRLGKNGPLDHFQIPKLELAQHVSRSIRLMGAPYQWSSDITERCHITHVKMPYRLSNRRDYHVQCCRFLDRQEKQRLFRLFTTLKRSTSPLFFEMVNEARLLSIHFPETNWIPGVLSTEHHVGSVHSQKSIFNNPRSRVSATNARALLLTVRPHRPNLLLHDAMVCLRLDDLIPALGDFFSGRTYTARNGRRFSSPNCSLPFQAINIWEKFRIQQRSVQDVQAVAPTQTVQAAPPSEQLPFGRANTVLVSHESGDLMSADPESELRAILQPICHSAPPPLIYVEFFNFSNLHYYMVDNIRVVAPAPKIEMFVVQRRFRSNGRPLGDIIPLDNVRQVIQLIPKFGVKAPREMTCDNCLDVGREFYLNSFADKETFHAILSYQ